MSTVAEIVAAVEKLPEAQKDELLEKLREIETKPTGLAQKRFVVKTWPLGIHGDKLPSHLSEELQDGPIFSDSGDLEQAFGWFLKAAPGGHANAMGEVGRMLIEGAGAPMDAKAGFEWLTKAGEEGDEEAVAYLPSLRRTDGSNPTV